MFKTPDVAAIRLEMPLTGNRYAYCGNNPLRYVDPKGYTFGDSNGNDSISNATDGYFGNSGANADEENPCPIGQSQGDDNSNSKVMIASGKKAIDEANKAMTEGENFDKKGSEYVESLMRALDGDQKTLDDASKAMQEQRASFKKAVSHMGKSGKAATESAASAGVNAATGALTGGGVAPQSLFS